MLNKRHRRVFGYARVSSEEQAKGTSLQDQESVLHAAARDFGFPSGIPVGHMMVEAESAIYEKLERREEMLRLLGLPTEGDIVLCALVDRWSRDPEFTYSSVRQLLARKVDVYFVVDRCDPSTHDGDSHLGMRILFAREEHKRIKLRLVGTRKGLLDKGLFAEGTPPLGYRRALPKGHKGADKNVLQPVESEVELVVKIFQWACAGIPIRRVAIELGMDSNRVQYMLHNRTYLGEVRDRNGNWIQGKHMPIVDADLFSRAQAALASRRQAGSRPRADAQSRDWILRDVARCARCGAVMGSVYGPLRGKVREDGDPRIYYYRCSHRCSRGVVGVRKIESLAAPMVLERLVELREEIAREPKARPPKVGVDHDSQIEKLSARRARVIDLFSEGVIERDELRTRLGKVDEELLRVRAARDAAKRPDPMADATVRRSLLGQIDVLTKAWERADGVQRRKLVTVLAKEFRIERGQPPIPTWRTPAELMEAITK